MKQCEATPQRPFYSVAYQWKHNPWTLYSCNYFVGAPEGQTMQGTDSFEQAKATADRCVTERNIVYAVVSKTEDCYNHSTVYEKAEGNET